MVVKGEHINGLQSRWSIWIFIAMFLCATIQLTAQTGSQKNYFRTESGIPHIPTLSAKPASAEAGAVYINSADNKVYWYTGSWWMVSDCCMPIMAPDGTMIVDIISPTTGRIWMDRNLGATQAATSSTDAASYGYYFQWSRAADGHQVSTSATYSGPVANSDNSVNNPWYGKFITNPTAPQDWLSTQLSDGSLWWNNTSVGANNPCPTGYHVPTVDEWAAEITSAQTGGTATTGGMTNAADAFNLLKIPKAGCRDFGSGAMDRPGIFAPYWTSSVFGTQSGYARFDATTATMRNNNRTYGFPIRCIKDITTNSAPVAGSVTQTGTFNVGAVITGDYSYSDADNDAEGSSSYQWYRASVADGSSAIAISGANSKTYKLTSEDMGKYIGFEVTPAAHTGTTPGATVKTTTFTLVNSMPVAASVTQSGIFDVGSVVTGDYSYTDADTDGESTSTYKWYRASDANGTDAIAISGANGKTYTPTSADMGKYIGFEVTPVASAGSTPGRAVMVSVFDKVNSAPVATNVQQSGTLIEGFVLTGSYTYSDADGNAEATSTFKWYRASDANGTGATAISGATGISYTLTNADAGYYIGFEVTPVAATGTTTGAAVKVATFGGSVIGLITSSPTGRIWLDRNLGATRAATSSTDAASYGFYFQWSRAADGHELPGSALYNNGTVANSDNVPTNPWYGKFVNTNNTSINDWLSTPLADGSLWWNGTTVGANNPCPTGFHVPTLNEWQAELDGGISDLTTAYNRLKLPMNGYRDFASGSVTSNGYAYYWSSTVGPVGSMSAYRLSIGSSLSSFSSGSRNAHGFSVRCIKDIAADAPVASAVSQTYTNLNTGGVITGSYSYSDSENDAEGNSMYKWYRASDASGKDATIISGATAQAYTLTSADHGYYIGFEVTPVAATGSNLGAVVRVATFSGPVVGTIVSSASGRTWMDRNLGATQVATSSTDAASYGSYFQWSRAADGHQVSTSTTYSGPVASAANGTGNAWYGKFILNTTAPNDWVSSLLSDGSLWWNGTTAGANNPCPAGFHVPTKTEWQAEISVTQTGGTAATSGITGATNAYSLLKVPMAGARDFSNGVVGGQGVRGLYWTSNPGGMFDFDSGYAIMNGAKKAYGFSVRCIKDIAADAPVASAVSQTYTHLNTGGVITGSYTYSDAQNDIEGASKYKWYRASDASGTGATAISGVTAQAYTLTSADHGYYIGFEVTPVALTGATPGAVVRVATFNGPVVGTIVSTTTNRIWMDRNLGATQVATSSTDYLAYGNLYQWSRAADGHEKITWTGATTGTPVNGTTTTLSATSVPGHSLFITPSSWMSTPPSDGSLWWNGTTVGANNPCPSGFHVPTKTEWQAELDGGITDVATAYMRLKLPMAGFRNRADGSLTETGTRISYWSSSVNGMVYFVYGTLSVAPSMPLAQIANGFSVRCIKDIAADAPVASNVVQSGTQEVGSMLTGSYTYSDAQSDAEGISMYKWYRASDASGTGATAISGATAQAYTLTSADAGYYIGFEVTPVAATGATPGAAVKVATFSGPVVGTIVSSASGRTWMDRNLGATQVATSSTDAANYGSYFQWSRAADGHQVSTSATYNGPVASAANGTGNAWYGKFILNTTAPNDWVSPSLSDGSLWWNGTTAGANNPCPAGFHVPTLTEWQAETSILTNAPTAYNNLKLTLGGSRSGGDNGIYLTGSHGRYWSSSASGANLASFIQFATASGLNIFNVEREYGIAIRCIKD